MVSDYKSSVCKQLNLYFVGCGCIVCELHFLVLYNQNMDVKNYGCYAVDGSWLQNAVMTNEKLKTG